MPGVIRGVEADTSFLAGNYAPRISIQAAYLKQGNKDLEILGGTNQRTDEYGGVYKGTRIYV